MAKIKPEKKVKEKKLSKKERLELVRNLRIDTTTRSAVMELNSFDGGNKLNGFFRKSFRKLEKQDIEHLVIDIRGNGGGKVNHFTRLTQYVKKTEFKVADTAFALRKNFSPYGKYFSSRTLNSIALGLFTSKRSDGNFHFKYWENHRFKPKKNNFFEGKVYVLIAGPTFSASALFAHHLKGQDNVLLVGEETGGASYGNNGLMIPNVQLPNTGIRVRMPLFRLIQYQHGPKDGRGILPDVYVGPSARAVIDKVDLKMKKTMELIRDSSQQASH
jgi:C-terminal processing protease CtpA/Prc